MDRTVYVGQEAAEHWPWLAAQEGIFAGVSSGGAVTPPCPCPGR